MRKAKANSPKDEVRKILSRIPDNVTLEDIQYHIYVREKIERGLKDLSEGRLLAQDEIESRMARWLGK